ncbi:MAG: transposase domain-containing protein [Paracoccus sp. (in: a-proteobacteria)]
MNAETFLTGFDGTLQIDGYLKATLTAIANGHPQSRLDGLLPWNFKPSS